MSVGDFKYVIGSERIFQLWTFEPQAALEYFYYIFLSFVRPFQKREMYFIFLKENMLINFCQHRNQSNPPLEPKYELMVHFGSGIGMYFKIMRRTCSSWQYHRVRPKSLRPYSTLSYSRRIKLYKVFKMPWWYVSHAWHELSRTRRSFYFFYTYYFSSVQQFELLKSKFMFQSVMTGSARPVRGNFSFARFCPGWWWCFLSIWCIYYIYICVYYYILCVFAWQHLLGNVCLYRHGT